MPMLETLTIKNFGIIEQTTMEFSRGLNILTGETGAGKSILIDALRFALGERFHTSYLRTGAESCTVEAVFSLNPSFLQTLPYWEDFKNDDHSLVIQRTVTADGRNKARLNGLTIPITQLKEIGALVIDFHGPNDHQQLLAEDQHLSIIDALTGSNIVSNDYSTIFKQYLSIKCQLTALQELALSRERDIGLLSHQIKELEQVALTEDELTEIELDRIKINNAEKLYTHITQAMAILENDEVSLESLLSKAFKPLQHLSDIDEKASVFLNSLSVIQENASSLISDLRNYADSLNFDPGFALSVNSRYDAYVEIKRKYGPTLTDAKKYYDEIKTKFALLNDFEHNEEDLKTNLKDKETALNKLAKTITQQRKKTAELLKATIEKELKELAFKSISFEARIDKAPLSLTGADNIVFFISTNIGEELKPLADIVSSGEAARLMLAIKRALMKVDPVPVLIFDEVDAQIGGRLGTVIGTKLKEVSQHRQVILITHLPQIAAFANSHFKISKTTNKGRTITIVEPLEPNERINELAHMMSGEAMTAVSIKHAKDLLNVASKSINRS
ncbi:MAG: DNA repair protein RecN [Candidatus Omnitrophica bacterium]|nr:DNA repair protein RecN [Candidatus Omnitrophota bacterium]